MPSEEENSCPCKHLSPSLSSFTAAERGDLASLVRQRDTIAARTDGTGNTPLHLAAQHGHVTATAMLIRADCDVNAAQSGATPLHRASYSGAVACMELLLQKKECDLLAIDASFGDRQTPLHKAASGGRPLAVKLLLEELARRNLLDTALTMVDARGKTPLDVAREKEKNQRYEQAYVARWDDLAGGPADWKLCVHLLQQSYRQTPIRNSTVVPFPMDITYADCTDCGTNCRTAIWEKAFLASLCNRLQTDDAFTLSSQVITNEGDVHHSEAQSNHQNWTTSSRETQINAISEQHSKLGRCCSRCGYVVIALYKSRKDSTLLCKSCWKRN